MRMWFCCAHTGLHEPRFAVAHLIHEIPVLHLWRWVHAWSNGWCWCICACVCTYSLSTYIYVCFECHDKYTLDKDIYIIYKFSEMANDQAWIDLGCRRQPWHQTLYLPLRDTLVHFQRHAVKRVWRRWWSHGDIKKWSESITIDRNEINIIASLVTVQMRIIFFARCQCNTEALTDGVRKFGICFTQRRQILPQLLHAHTHTSVFSHADLHLRYKNRININ